MTWAIQIKDGANKNAVYLLEEYGSLTKHMALRVYSSFNECLYLFCRIGSSYPSISSSNVLILLLFQTNKRKKEKNDLLLSFSRSEQIVFITRTSCNQCHISDL